VVINMGVVGLCVLKGKFKMALFGIFLSPLAYLGAIRLARPTSSWARRRYARQPLKLARATRRTERFDARWDPLACRVSDLLGGRPSEPDPS
jgi:hypothetical protein